MKTKFVQYGILSYDTNLILDAPHAKPPRADKFTGIIVKNIAENLKTAYVVSLVSRELEADLNRDENFNLPLQKVARKEYIEILKHIRDSIKKPVIHIAIHGIKDDYGYDFVIGTRYGKICDLKKAKILKDLLQKEFKKLGLSPVIVIDEIFIRDKSLEKLKKFLGENYQIIQLEISRKYRELYQEKTIKTLINAFKILSSAF